MEQGAHAGKIFFSVADKLLLYILILSYVGDRGRMNIVWVNRSGVQPTSVISGCLDAGDHLVHVSLNQMATVTLSSSRVAGSVAVVRGLVFFCRIGSSAPLGPF
jgi:hypothetical protein